MKKLLLLASGLAVLSMNISCEKEELNYFTKKITGTGEIVTQYLELPLFSSIELDGVANLYLTSGADQSVVLKAQQNIIDVMNWEVESGILTISLDEGITLHNHEEIRFDIAVAEFYNLVHDGVGDVSLQGNTGGNLSIDFRGVGSIHAYALPVDYCTVMSSAVGDCKVQVNNLLEVDLSGAGDVYYRGNPQISSTDTGLGDLINDN